VVFSWIAETIQIERWEGTLEYTFMAPIRRSTHLLGAVAYAMIYGLIHTAAIVVAMVLFFPDEVAVAHANIGTIAGFMLLGSFSLVGVAMLAAILPLLFVERGMQMAFVLQSVLLLISGVYYSIDVLPGWMQVLSWFSPATYALDGVRQGLIDGVALPELWGDIWPLAVMGTLFIPLGLWAFGTAERYAKRTGKLKRVG
jgi:ABC-2 type transport system permease protein